MILVVEDDVTTREGLNLLLQHEGYRVAVAANGQEALEQLRDGPRPDLILLDMLMPVLDGWHFLTALKENQALDAVQVLVTTVVPLSREWADDHGCCGFLKKPINTDLLLAEVRRCLGKA
jgi:CheY-like chemotaxis protein